MKQRIRRIGVHQTAKVIGVAYAGIALLFVPFFFLALLLTPSPANEAWGGGPEMLMGPAFALLAPVVYGAMGYLTTAVFCLVYNLIASMVGGIEIELEPTTPVG